MAKVTMLFYRAFDNPHATLLDKLVAWLDGGIHSHVEVVTNNAPWALHTVGCHLMRVGWMAGACRFGSCSRLLARQRLALKSFPLVVVFLALQVAKPPLYFRAAI